MSKVFYDRSGRPHTIGKRKGGEEAAPQEEKSSKSSKKPEKKPDRKSEKKFGKKSGAPRRTENQNRYPEKQKSDGKRNWKGDRITQTRPSDKSYGDRYRDDYKRSGNETPSRHENPRHETRNRRQDSYANDRSASRGGKLHRKGPNKGQNELQRLVGTVDKNKKGSGFLIFDRRDLEDVFIPRELLANLFHGDRVEVFINARGEIEDLQVKEHRFKEIYGRVQLSEEKPAFAKRDGAVRNAVPIHPRTGQKAPPKVVAWLQYERKKAAEKVFIPTVEGFNVKDGDWVRAQMVFGERTPTAEIIEVFGPDLPASEDLKMVAGEFGLIEHHSAQALAEAQSYKLEIPEGDWTGTELEGRTDLRHLDFITIDGITARDFDDAVVVENLGGAGFRLWVAIADVSHYVREGTALDKEAYSRGTSVYFPERAFHMLPKALSENLCSIRPKVPRMAMATSIDFDRDGNKGEVKLYNAVIESRRRATYEEIQEEIQVGRYKDLYALYKILHKKRRERGSLDFDFPEAEIKLDEQTGEPFDCVIRNREDSHRLIEEFMIAANESVTEWMLARGLPFLYRIHEAPSVESIVKFVKLARSQGVGVHNVSGSPRPKVLSEFLQKLEGHEAEGMLSQALLRSLKQAIYSAHHDEHYGLASEAYTHFTSPIRRYPDLVVHRLLRRAIAVEEGREKPMNRAQAEQVEEKLEEIAEHTSYRERVAQEADREATRFKQLRLMKKHLGEVFEAKITGLHEKGIFAQILRPYCEGLIPVDALIDDDYQFNEDRMILAGRRKKRTFKIGQSVNIQIVRVDLDSRQAELTLEEFAQLAEKE